MRPHRPSPLSAFALAALALAAAAGCRFGGGSDDAPDEKQAPSGDVIYLSDTVLPPGTVLGGPESTVPPPPPDTQRTAVVDSVLRSRIVTGEGSYIEVNGQRITFGEDGTVHIDTVDADGNVRRRPAGGFVPAAEALWKPVGRWAGTGRKSTESFRVGSNEWRIVYGGTPRREPSWQRVSVLDSIGQQFTSARRDGAGTDTSYVHRGPGVFSLDIDGYNSRWTVAVEEKALPAERITPP